MPLNLVSNCQALQFRHQTPVSTDDASYQSFVAKVIQSTFLAVALSCGIDQRQIAWLVGGRNRLITLREIERLDRQNDFLGEADPDKAACGNRVTISYEARRFLCADDLSAVQCNLDTDQWSIFRAPASMVNVKSDDDRSLP